MARAESSVNPLQIWKGQLDDRSDQIAAVLPAHVPVERFKRTAFTAAMQNPDLLVKCDRTSLFNAVMRAATDGLMPDGREGAIVEFKGKAQWMPMVAGIRKKVRQSGEISTWDAHAVYEADEFDYQLGDKPFIYHKPALRNRGEMVAVYSIATLKSGEVSREVMTVEDVEKVREVSRAWNRGPWVDWYEEMAKKTVARRHSKVLPMNTDLDAMMRHDDAVFGVPEQMAPEAVEDQRPARPPAGLKGKLAMLAGGADAKAAPKAAQSPPEAQQKPVEKKAEPQRDVTPDPEEERAPLDETQAQVIDEDGVIEHEPEREQVDPIAAAEERGAKARREGYQRRAVPPEYRREDRSAEAEAWVRGWVNEDKRLREGAKAS